MATVDAGYRHFGLAVGELHHPDALEAIVLPYGHHNLRLYLRPFVRADGQPALDDLAVGVVLALAQFVNAAVVGYLGNQTREQ